MIEKAKKFFERDIWYLASQGKGALKHAIRLLTIFYVAGRDFIADKCGIRSSALTFYTVLSLVPILALAFGIAKGFGFEEKLKASIVESSDQNQEIFMYMFNFAENALSNTKGGLSRWTGSTHIIVYLDKDHLAHRGFV